MYAHRPLIPRAGAQDGFDSGIVFPAARFITRGGEHLLFYEGRRVRHEDRYSDPGGIGVAAWRAGRLAGIAALGGGCAGTVVTKPFALPRHTAAIVVDANTTRGEVYVVLEYAGGGTVATAEELRGLDASAPLRWRGGGGIPAAALASGQRVRLRFVLRDAVLYSFTPLSTLPLRASVARAPHTQRPVR